MNPDERGNWTSASAAECDLLCPGRHLAQRGLPEGESTPDAESGTRIHAALAGEAVTLTADEEETCDKCREIERKLVADWTIKDYSAPGCYREQRMWIEFGNLMHSGKPDVVYVQGTRALVIDFKTGRNEVTENPKNQQLRDLAVMAARTYQALTVTVAIIQPWAVSQPPCEYDIMSLLEALDMLEYRVKASNNPNAQRIAGETQCKYCRAKATCPAFAAAALPVAVKPENLDNPGAQAAVTIAIQLLDETRLGAFLSLSRLASGVAEDEVRRRLTGGIAVQGWSFKPGRTTEKVSDPQKCFERFVAAGGTTEAFLQTVTVGKTKLKDAVRAVTGAKGKALEAAVDKLIDGITESKTSEPILAHD